MNSKKIKFDVIQQKILRTAIINGLARGANLGVSLLAVPLMLKKYGVEDFGLWATMVSLISFGSFLDLGLGNALLNSVSKLHVSEDFLSIQKQITTATVSIAIISLFLICAVFLILPFADFGSFFGARPVAARYAFAALTLPFLALLPFSLASRIMLAIDLATTDALWQLSSSLILGVALLFCTTCDAGVWLAVLASSLIPSLMRTAQYFALPKINPLLRFSKDAFAFESARSLAKPAILFFILQLAAASIFLSDNLIISRSLGATEGATYSLAARIFAIPIAFQGLLLGPIWPQLTKTIHLNGFRSVRKHVFVMWLLTGIGGLLFAFFVILFREPFFSAWTRSQGPIPSRTIIMFMGMWSVVQLLGAVNGTILNAAEVIRFQIGLACTAGILAFGAKLYGASKYGSSGVIGLGMLVYLFVSFFPSLFFISARFKSESLSRSV